MLLKMGHKLRFCKTYICMFQVSLLAISVFYILADALRELPQHTQEQTLEKLEPVFRNNNALRRVLASLVANKQLNTRRLNSRERAKAKNFFKTLAKIPKKKLQKLLREGGEKDAATEGTVTIVRDEQAAVVENELIDALNKKSSALLARPYVEKKGQNDFLVMNPGIVDPFVTQVPNAIYYNIEKKCVNWLDDCSLQGIRTKLLNTVNYPYK